MTIIDQTTSSSEPAALRTSRPEPFLYDNDGVIPKGWQLSEPPIGTTRLAFDPKRHTVVRSLLPDAELGPDSNASVREALADAGFDAVEVPNSLECYFVRDRSAPDNTKATTRSVGAGLGR